MFRGYVYKQGVFRQGVPVVAPAGSGNLNVLDLTNYTIPFTLQADTAQAFTINGEVNITSCYIADEGYYEAGMYDLSGSYYVRRFCFLTNLTADPLNFEIISRNEFVSKLNQNLTVKGNKENTITTYCKRPVIASFSDDIEIKGLVWNRTFYNSSGNENNIKIISNRTLTATDNLGNNLYSRKIVI